jgi:hypothetical protein
MISSFVLVISFIVLRGLGHSVSNGSLPGEKPVVLPW